MTLRRTRRPRAGPRLTHFEEDRSGTRSRMVDVGEKRVSARSALARARVRFPPGVLEQVLAGGGPKGALTEVARVAGILAAKRTGELIPMCHPVGLDHIEIRFEPRPPSPGGRRAGGVLEIRCRAACRGRTGVEMEALVGAAVAALTVYDMTKGLEKGISIEQVELLEKRGGRSGTWKRKADAR